MGRSTRIQNYVTIAQDGGRCGRSMRRCRGGQEGNFAGERDPWIGMKGRQGKTAGHFLVELYFYIHTILKSHGFFHLSPKYCYLFYHAFNLFSSCSSHHLLSHDLSILHSYFFRSYYLTGMEIWGFRGI